MIRLHLLLPAGLASLLLAGCGGAAPPLAAGGPSGAPGPGVAVPALPAPHSIRPRHTSTLVDIVDGQDYDPLLNHHTMPGAGVACEFAPADASGSAARAAVAYSVYELVPDTALADPQLHLAWNAPGPPPGSVWVGLANFATGRWVWQPASADSNYPVDLAGGSNVGSGGRVLAAVLVTGTTPCSLNRVRITAANMPPSGDVDHDAADRGAPFTLQWTAGKSDDDDGAIVRYEWDFDGDGTYDFDSTQPEAAFDVTHNGNYLCWVRLTDDEGASVEYPSAWDTGFRREWTSQNLPYDTYFRDAIVAADGSFYVCGYVQNVPASSEYHALLIHYLADGTLDWARAIASAGNDIGTALALRPAGGVYLAGTWNRAAATGSIFFDQFAADGSQVSHRVFGTPDAYGDVAMALDGATGSVYLSAAYDAGGATGKQATVHKLDGSGAWQWTRIWGGNGNDQARGIALDAAGNVLCGLYTEAPASVNCGVLKLQPDGAQLGGRIYDETQWDFNLQGLAVNAAADRLALYGGLMDGVDGGQFLLEVDPLTFDTTATALLSEFGGLGRQFRDGAYDAAGDLWLTGNGVDQSGQADGLLYTWHGGVEWDFFQSGPGNADNTLGGLALAPAGGVLVVGYDSTAGSAFYDVTRSTFGTSMMLPNLPYTVTNGANPSSAAASTVSNLQPAAGAAQQGGVLYMYYPELAP